MKRQLILLGAVFIITLIAIAFRPSDSNLIPAGPEGLPQYLTPDRLLSGTDQARHPQTAAFQTAVHNGVIQALTETAQARPTPPPTLR